MITIKDNKIWFVHEFKEGEKKRPSFSAELLSAYLCPVCHNILKAFFKGNFSYPLDTYTPRGIEYQFGYVPGGTYMNIMDHSCYAIAETFRECKEWEIVKKSGGIACSLKTLSTELGYPTTPSDFFVYKLTQNKEEYLRVVPDMIGNDDPILMFHRGKIIGVDIDDNIDSWYDRNQRIGEIFAGLITEEGTIETDIDKVIDNDNVIDDQVVTITNGKKMIIQKGQTSLFSF